MKEIRKAVRTYLIKDNKVVVIRYKKHDIGYFDIPGGKIEDSETADRASIREFKEETGMTILEQHHIGHSFIEYPDRIFDFSIYIVDKYLGEPTEFEENESMWADVPDLLKETRIFPSIEMIKLLKDGMDLKIKCDKDHRVIK